MRKGRLEAFSDGVIAILITIMVFDLKAPAGADEKTLLALLPAVLTYLLSFVYLAIYWNNHHHLWVMADRVNGRIMWANMHLLFWLSLIPFGTGWLHRSDFAPLPVAVYGVILSACTSSWMILQSAIIAQQGPASALRAAVGNDLKSKLSIALYLSAVFLAYWQPAISLLIYLGLALVWIPPDRRFECAVDRQKGIETAQASAE
ncbi:TMEM175 family protein [Blastopirellula marina]|uniref:DUF1211 domain-containing protein n=1 Tax=Blastopirellula marina TaxID=124 RepID=A0A2S8GM11_9BACT|nr:TMEM175 family protein [Blastopirellula marina]PQO45465.1 hypothetical protein C5Y93_13520 [Blastopirellula marina]